MEHGRYAEVKGQHPWGQSRITLGQEQEGKEVMKNFKEIESQGWTGQVTEKVKKELKTLGTLRNMYGKTNTEVFKRIQNADAAFRLYFKFLTCDRVPIYMRGLVFKAVVESVLLFNLEVAPVTPNEVRRLDDFLVRRARRILGKKAFFETACGEGSRWKSLPKWVIRTRVGIDTVESTLCFRRIKYFRGLLREEQRGNPVPQLAAVFGSTTWEKRKPCFETLQNTPNSESIN